MNPLQWLIQPIAGAFNAWQDRKARITEAKTEREIAIINAEAVQAGRAQEIEGNYDLLALKMQEKSLKDEYLTLLLSAPFIGSFIPEVQDYVAKGWQYVASAPPWYTWAFIGVIVATFGLRGWKGRP